MFGICRFLLTPLPDGCVLGDETEIKNADKTWR